MSEAMAECRRILARSGSSFATAFRILPREERDALTAFYAFCRAVDDDVDECSDAGEAARRLGAWRRRVDALSGAGAADPVSSCLGWAAERFGIERRLFHLVLDGVETDLRPVRFETFAELYEYCYRVASAVGLVCVRVLGGAEAGRAETYAELTGIAVQLTNVLRDVGEDSRLGRIYLPLEDLRAFGVREEEVLLRLRTPGLERLWRFQWRRATEYYELAGAALPPELQGRLFFAEALRATYRRLLGRIEEEGFPVLERRVTVPMLERVVIALRHRLHPRTLVA